MKENVEVEEKPNQSSQHGTWRTLQLNFRQNFPNFLRRKWRKKIGATREGRGSDGISNFRNFRHSFQLKPALAVFMSLQQQYYVLLNFFVGCRWSNGQIKSKKDDKKTQKTENFIPWIFFSHLICFVLFHKSWLIC